VNIYIYISLIPYIGSVLSVFERRTSLLGKFFLLVFAIILASFIGFRFEVGKDWIQYNYIFDQISDLQFLRAVEFTDAGYAALNWITYQFGFGATATFFACATVLATRCYSYGHGSYTPGHCTGFYFDRLSFAGK